MKTRMTELLGIEYPIICGGMFQVGRPRSQPLFQKPGTWYHHFENTGDTRGSP
ncbi:hypothetical protein KEH51_29590 [[Brevibacterium] frigoritolerans]|uniref:Nitronate monooxygenase domain-containing protein n=1 Tax=Peribacillus frigoritolerans TaxID=450367 RepID=A0A941FP81_9BACI|nr:hypothetical protein [Peribacillus frigoritolerans]